MTVVYPRTVNFKDQAGEWQPIDDSLVPSSAAGFALENKANSLRLLLPATLAGSAPRIAFDGGWLAFKLVGAKGTVVPRGREGRVLNALTATTVSDSVTGDRVRETLTLASLAAPKSFAYDIALSDGLTARETEAGAVEFVAGNEVKGAFTPATMTDAAGAASPVATTLTATGDGYRYILTPDRAWLSDSARRWPVVIDPDFSPASSFASNGAGTVDCYMQSGSPTTSFCPGDTDVVGWNGSQSSRMTLDYGIPSGSAGIPSTATILNATLSLYLTGESSTASAPISIYNAAKRYKYSPNWTYYNTLSNLQWTTLGGDIDTSAVVTKTIGGTINTLHTFDVAELVRKQASGESVGAFIVKQQSENVNNMLQFAGSSNVSVPTANLPTLTVWWVPATGQQGRWQFQTIPLSGRMIAGVNLASGNLLVTAGDMDLEGTGLDVEFGHYYNGVNGPVAGKWDLGPGGDTYLVPNQFGDGTAQYTGMNGATVAFTKNQDGSYNTPAGLDVKLEAATGALAACSGASYAYVITGHADQSKQYFDSSGYLIAKADNNGNANCYGYNASRKLTSIVDSKGRTTTIAYSSTATTVTDPASRTYVYTFNSSGRLTSYKDAAGKNTTYGYATSGMLNKITDPRGGVTNITYNLSTWNGGSGYRVASITRVCTCGNQVWSFAYNSQDDQAAAPFFTTVTDPRSQAWKFYYDGFGRITKTIDPGSHTRTVDFTDANGGQNCADDNPCSTTDALGNTTRYGYNVAANGVQLGENLVWSQSPVESTTNRPAFAYGSSGASLYNPKQYTDSIYAGAGTAKHSWLYGYDGNANLTSKSEGDDGAGQNPVTFTYNSDGTLATATDARGKVTRYCYDAAQNCTGVSTHNLTAVLLPSPLGAVKLSYDSLSRVSTVTDGKGQTRTYTYDNLDRVTQVAYSGGPTLTTTYDENDNVLTTTDPSGTYTYRYDALNRLSSEDQPGPRTISYGYDAASNLTSLVDASGTTTYTYDNENQLATVHEPGVTGSISFAYDANGRRTQITYPTAPTTTTEVLQYDAAGQLTGVYAQKPLGGTTIASFTYCYKATPSGCTGADTGLRTSMTATYPGAAAATTYYCYDGLGRLSSADSSSTCPNASAAYQYSYDVSGNMTTKTVSGTTTTYAYNDANQITNSGYAYDGNGSQTADPGVYTSATYNVLDQTGSFTPSGGTAYSLGYKGAAQAIRVSNGGAAQINDQLGLNADVGSPTTYFTRDSDGAVLGERRSGSYYFLHDGLGSVIGVVDSTGAVVSTYKYDPFGAQTAITGTLYQPIRYTGGYWDGTTSGHVALYKFGQRYYDPSVGRWTQPDPVNNPLDLKGWNGYTYAGDDPVNNIDPLGERPIRGGVWRWSVNWLKSRPGDRFVVRVGNRYVKIAYHEHAGGPHQTPHIQVNTWRGGRGYKGRGWRYRWFDPEAGGVGGGGLENMR